MEESGMDHRAGQDAPDPEGFVYQQPEPQVRLVLLGLLGASLLFAILGGLLFQLIVLMAGWDPTVLTGALAADAPPAERWQTRLLLAISHVSTFLLAGWVVLYFFYPPAKRVFSYLKAVQLPDIRPFMLGILLMLVAIPLVLYTYNINQALPLPDALRALEDQTNESIKGLLQMDNVLELLANLLLIALLPALGEELVFRGIVQQQLMRRMRPWAAILLGAAVFSFIHFQFEGFLPRMLLGVVLGWLYWRSQNIWVPVGAHFVNNAFQVVGQYLYNQDLSTIDLEQDIDMPWMAAAVSVVLIYGIVRWAEPYWANPSKT
ncbi:MAG: CPBP family intramembrane metalloprotease [Saprospiraceae bacterium]|nr:CPBP family intramembrane metalloprotease [Saprospiraceae bacterium]